MTCAKTSCVDDVVYGKQETSTKAVEYHKYIENNSHIHPSSSLSPSSPWHEFIPNNYRCLWSTVTAIYNIFITLAFHMEYEFVTWVPTNNRLKIRAKNVLIINNFKLINKLKVPFLILKLRNLDSIISSLFLKINLRIFIFLNSFSSNPPSWGQTWGRFHYSFSWRNIIITTIIITKFENKSSKNKWLI